MKNDLISIIMLSRNKEQFLEASVRSIMAQTYQNWELLFVDDASDDKTISLLMKLKEEDRRRGKKFDGKELMDDGALADRINITSVIESRGEAINRNSALNSAKGRWIAFLNAGDVWEPTKLERQVAFMEEHDYAFTYTNFSCIDAQMKYIGVTVTGPEHISHKEMKKSCWMGYQTVMYDAKKMGKLLINGLKTANDYALWLMAVRHADCHLLPECLASQMLEKGLWYRLLTSKKWTWRYGAYRKI